jgi:hypothetical protein
VYGDPIRTRISTSEPSPGDRPHESLTEHLEVIRRRLDLLAAARLDKPLDMEAEEMYQTLCRQERELLQAMSTAAEQGTGKET